MATADSVVVELIARTGDYEASVKRAARTTDQAVTVIERSTGRAANATRNLGRQVSDIGVGLAGGQSPFLILAQQAPQVADALADTGGKAARLAAFFAVPWGAALLAAGSIAGVFAGKLLEGGDAADKHKKAVDLLKEAQDRLVGSSALASHETEIGIQLDIRATEMLRRREVQTRKLIQAQLEQQIALRTFAAKTALSGQPDTEYAGLALPGLDSGIGTLQQQLAKQNIKIRDADRAIQGGKAALVLRRVAGATDAATAATQKYDNTIDLLTRRFERGKLGEAEFERLSTAAARAKKATLDGIKEEKSARKKAESEANADRKKAEREAITERKKALREADAEMKRVNKSMSDLLILSNKTSLKDLGIDPAGDLKDVRRALDDADKRRQTASSNFNEGHLDEEKRLQDERERNIRSLASLYEDLFMGGTRDLWQTFERLGISALAKLAAKQTLPGLTSLFTGLLGRVMPIQGLGTGALTSALSGLSANLPTFSGPFVPARASGGYVGAGQLYRVNEGASAGRVEGFRPSGSGTIIPLGQMAHARAGGGTTVLQTMQFDLSGAVVTSDLLAQMNAMAEQAAVRGAAGGSNMAQGALARRARSRLG